MTQRRVAALLAIVMAGLVATACAAGPSAAIAPSAPLATATARATATPAAATDLAWTVSKTSKATVRVREQLASLSFPSDAVLVAAGATGSFQVKADGSFVDGSNVTFNVDSLASDSSQRDGFVKRNVLDTRQFPTATFVPKATRTGGDLTATATLAPTVRFGDFGMPLPAAPGRVLSVVDEIKLVIDLVATGPTG